MHLRRIHLYPIKSLDGVSVPEARITPAGTLTHDREYALFDGDRQFVNGKRRPRVHQLRAAYDGTLSRVTLWEQGKAEGGSFTLAEREPLEAWLGGFFGFRVHVERDTTRGFPDDTDAMGPTVVGEESLRAVTGWFPGLSLEEVRRRFRTNLEIGGAAAFCEDHLIGERPPGCPVEFRIGDVRFLGHNACQRCPVPTRDPDTGIADASFASDFTALRKLHLPAWANASRFNHFYRFALNTSIPRGEAGKILRVGDSVSVN